jgi:mRNA-degrading endonuclease toxin of MazEF toxin-antitoxin module
VVKRNFFQEREIWWCSLGLNIGFEQDGRGNLYDRPVLVLKKFNLEIFLGIPLTTSEKTGKYYFDLGIHGRKSSVAILSQLRLFDAKRLSNKISVLNKDKFIKIKKAIKEVNFS